jgi:hypothetical protein
METHSTYPILVVFSIFAYGMGLFFGVLITTYLSHTLGAAESIDESSHVCSCEEP